MNDNREEETDVAPPPEIAALIEQLNGRLRVSKDELVAEIEAHLSDLLGIDLSEAMRAVAARQNIRQADNPSFGRCHKSALVLLSHVLYQARIKSDLGRQRVSA